MNTVLTRLLEVEPPWAFPLPLLRYQSLLGIGIPECLLYFPTRTLYSSRQNWIADSPLHEAQWCYANQTLQSARLLYLWDFPGKNTVVSCHFLLQGIFPIQGLNPDLLHGRPILYQLSYQESSCKSEVLKNSCVKVFLIFSLLLWKF